MADPKSSTSERWTRIERIFHATLEQHKPQRAAWLDRQCADDAALRREIERLLQADDESEAFLRDPAFGSGFVTLTPEELSDAADPTEIGPYRLMHRLGSGGATIIEGLSIKSHFDDFGPGIIDTKHIVYYLSFIAFFLFMSVRVLESRRWR